VWADAHDLDLKKANFGGNPTFYQQNSHYRDRMHAEDLADPQLLTEVRYALDELTQILGLGVIYPFQR